MFALLIFKLPLNVDAAVADLHDDYFEDFEGSIFPAWEATGLWHIEDNDTSTWPINDLPSDSHYAWYGNSTTGNYNTGDWNYGFLTSDSINLTKVAIEQGSSIELGFWSWAETENIPDVDRKEIFVSVDGGSWDRLGQIPDSDYTWQYYGFDLSPYTYSEDVRIQFSFDTYDSYANNYRGWMLDNITIGSPRPRFELFIMQDTYATVGETRPIDFLVKSFYENHQIINITISMETPSGTEILLEEFYYTIEPYGTWDHNEQYVFTEPGLYTVIFLLTDFNTRTERVVECWWEIEPKPEDEFILHIDQDYYAGITDNRKMGFFIDSFFDISVQVNVTIKMENPSGVNETLLYETFVWIDSYSHWEEWLDYTFTQTGGYWVYFIVEDEFGVEWVYICWWEVEADFFDLWIDQETYAGITDYREMNFSAKSYFDHGTLINISIDIMTPSGPIENLFSEDWVAIEGFGFWDYSLEYSFLEAGEYIVLFSIVDEYGIGWSRECSWYIEEDFIDVWIEQDMEAFVGDTRTMSFNAKNYFESGMYITVLIEIDTPSGTETLLEETSWIDAYSPLSYSIDYTFTESGEYKVFFLVTDDYSNEYARDCYWKVHEEEEKERFELKIDQDYKADVGDEERMKFLVKSYFNHDMEVEINVTIKTPSGTVEILLHEMVWIYAYDTWDESVDYEFKEVGEYKVHFVLIDDIGSEWIEDCQWDISEAETETSETEATSSEGSSSPTIGITPGFESFLIISTIAAIAVYYRKHHV